MITPFEFCQISTIYMKYMCLNNKMFRNETCRLILDANCINFFRQGDLTRKRFWKTYLILIILFQFQIFSFRIITSSNNIHHGSSFSMSISQLICNQGIYVRTRGLPLVKLYRGAYKLGQWSSFCASFSEFRISSQDWVSNDSKPPYALNAVL